MSTHRTIGQLAASYGIPVTEILAQETNDALDDNERLRAAVLEAIQHLTHARPSHALRALEALEL